MKINSDTGRSRLKFASVKLVVLENHGQYVRTILFALGIGLSHVLIGSIVMATFIYTQNSEMSVHAWCSTLGYQFFCAQGILCQTHANGWSSPLKLIHRKWVHILFQVCGLGFSLYGTAVLITKEGIMSSTHSTLGFVAHICAMGSLMCGPVTMLNYKLTSIGHRVLGVVSFVMASISLCFGFYTAAFQEVCPNIIVYILLCFVIFATLCIAIHTLMRVGLKLQRTELN